MKNLFVLSLLLTSFSGFSQQNEFHWLTGTWQEENLPAGQAGKKSFEVWRDDGRSLSGISYQMDEAGNKTITEEIKLLKKENDFYFVPDVAGPQGEIEFKITSLNKNSFTAENPAHDFPKKIVYKTTKEKLIATISGGNKSIRYVYIKVK